MAAAIPVGICDLDFLPFDRFLFLQPFLSKLFSDSAFIFFTVTVREERRVDRRVLDEFWTF